MKSTFKILFPDVRDESGGKSYFLHSLYKELTVLGMNIVFSGFHDIVFGSVRYPLKSSSAKVLRLDGVIHNTAKNWREKNNDMRNRADAADVIICQSSFGYEMVKRYVQCDMNKAVIINNGMYLDHEVTLPEKKFEKNFLAISKWRPHKRLGETIEAFLNAAIPDSCLWVIGKISDDRYNYKKFFKQNKNIVYLGEIFDRRLLFGYMKSSIASIHLCWFDCYPNSVVEAVGMGCPVICNNTGGTREIVERSGGIVLEIDKPYDYKPVDLYNPPKIDINAVSDAMIKISDNRPKINNTHVDIKRIAIQYKKVFEKLAS